jgi:hypothetical protein
MKKLDLSWSKLKGGTTDRALSITGKKTGLMGRIRQEMYKQTPNFYMELHCTIHCEKTMRYEYVMKVVVSAVNFIQSHGLHC